MSAVHIGGAVTGSAVVVGDHNTANVTRGVADMAAAASVQAAIAAIRAELLAGEDAKGLSTQLEAAAVEVGTQSPDKDRVGKALELAVKYATQSDQLVERLTKLAPHVKTVCAWLGHAGQRLLTLAGLSG